MTKKLFMFGASLWMAALAAPTQLAFPPTLPGGQEVVTDTSEAFLKPTAPLREGVEIARTPPRIDFL